jgi:hypothetical protein
VRLELTKNDFADRRLDRFDIPGIVLRWVPGTPTQLSADRSGVPTLGVHWWATGDSNPELLVCRTSALAIELVAQKLKLVGLLGFEPRLLP